MPKDHPDYREAEIAVAEGNTPEEALEALLLIVRKKSPAGLVGIADARVLGLFAPSEQKKIRKLLDQFGVATTGKSERIFKTVAPADLELVGKIQGNPTVTERAPADDKGKKSKDDALVGYDTDFKNQKLDAAEISSLDRQIESLDFRQLAGAEHEVVEGLADKIFDRAMENGNFRYKFTFARFGLSLLGSSISLASAGYSKISAVTMGSLSAFMSGFIQWHTKRFFQLVSEHRLRVELRNIPISVRNSLAKKYARLSGKQNITLLDLLEIPVGADNKVIKSSEPAKLIKWGITEIGINAVTGIGRPLILAALFTGEMVWNGMGYTLPEEMRLNPVLLDIGLTTGICMLTQGYWETVLERIYNRASDFYKFAAASYTLQLQKLIQVQAHAEDILRIRTLRNRAIELSVRSFKFLSYGMLVGSFSWVVSASMLGQDWWIKYAPLFALGVGAKVISILKNPKVDLKYELKRTTGEKIKSDVELIKNSPEAIQNFFNKTTRAICEKTTKKLKRRPSPPDSDLNVPNSSGETP